MMRPIEKAFNFLLYRGPILKLKLLLIIIINTQTVFGQNNFNENTSYFIKEKGPYSLSIEVTKLKNNEGFIMLGLFDENNNKIISVKNIQIYDQKSIVKIDSIKSGKYVVRFWHDNNNNGKLDMNFLGIPIEEFGNSNNIRPKFGPPKFEDMIFKIEKNLDLKIIAQKYTVL